MHFQSLRYYIYIILHSTVSRHSLCADWIDVDIPCGVHNSPPLSALTIKRLPCTKPIYPMAELSGLHQMILREPAAVTNPRPSRFTISPDLID
jgi:hypothetical protein